jgi:ribosomal protein S18 acetylase RimI-like enzyme
MPSEPLRPLPGIVFRRLRSPSEHEAAGRLLADGGIPAAAVASSAAALFGLEDLAAPEGEGLVGVAATRPLDDAGSVELCGVAIRAGLRRRGLGRRLVTEVADALRVEGAACLVARLEADQGPAVALLRRACFTAAGGQAAGAGRGWRYLAL